MELLTFKKFGVKHLFVKNYFSQNLKNRFPNSIFNNYYWKKFFQSIAIDSCNYWIIPIYLFKQYKKTFSVFA